MNPLKPLGGITAYSFPRRLSQQVITPSVRFGQNPWGDPDPPSAQWRPKPLLTKWRLLPVGLLALGLLVGNQTGTIEKAADAVYTWLDLESQPPLVQMRVLEKQLLQQRIQMERLAKVATEKQALAGILNAQMWNAEFLEGEAVTSAYLERLRQVCVELEANNLQITEQSEATKKMAVKMRVLAMQLKDKEEKEKAESYTNKANWIEGLTPYYQKEADAAFQDAVMRYQTAASLANIPPNTEEDTRTPAEIRQNMKVAAAMHADTVKALVEKAKPLSEKRAAKIQFFDECADKYTQYYENACQSGEINPNDPDRPYYFGVDRWYDKMEHTYRFDLLDQVRQLKTSQLEAQEAVAVVKRYAEHLKNEAKKDGQAKADSVEMQQTLAQMEKHQAELHRQFQESSDAALKAKTRLIQVKEGTLQAWRSWVMDRDMAAEVAGR